MSDEKRSEATLPPCPVNHECKFGGRIFELANENKQLRVDNGNLRVFADRIETSLKGTRISRDELRKENERLRAALVKIADPPHKNLRCDDTCGKIAWGALKDD